LGGSNSLTNTRESRLTKKSILLLALQVLSPKGSIETSLYTQQPENSVAYATWTVPEGQAGGEYTLKMEYSEYGSMRCSPPTERKFQIRNFRSPKLNVRVEFLGRGYGPGDDVRAKVRSGADLDL
jgi:uncharacterized protein YfaS (alpha-2-macroglobulin family)